MSASFWTADLVIRRAGTLSSALTRTSKICCKGKCQIINLGSTFELYSGEKNSFYVGRNGLFKALFCFELKLGFVFTLLPLFLARSLRSEEELVELLVMQGTLGIQIEGVDDELIYHSFINANKRNQIYEKLLL